MYHFKTLASITATPRKNNRKSISSLKASIDSNKNKKKSQKANTTQSQ